MTSQQIGLLAIQLFVGLGVLAFVLKLRLDGRENELKYRFFAVRDKFLYLAATDVLPQSSMVFKVFYRAMNTYIAELDRFTIVSYLRASVAVKSELEKEDQRRLSESLRRCDPEVQLVVQEFIHVVMDALRHNSPMLNLVLVFASHWDSLFSFGRKVVQRFRGPRLEVYSTYRYYEDMYGHNTGVA
jgi:hypothetical protein